MRTVDNHLVDKMDEAVTHYINSHQSGEPAHVDTNGMALNVQDDGGGRLVTVMHSQTFPPQLCRQVSVTEPVPEGQWGEELLDTDGRLAALVAHLQRASHHQPHHKVPSVRDLETSVILDAPMRIFSGQPLDQNGEPILVEVPQLPPLPPLQDMKRCADTEWFNKKSMMKEPAPILAEGGPGLELASAKPSKKSLPHKKRISRKLKRNAGSSTPHQELVVINCTEEVQQEEILPDSFAPGPPQHLQEMRPILICQLCGSFFGTEQLKFYQHLKQHYEPQHTIIIENPVADLGIDKMTNTCIVDNVATLPDSIVELSLENTVPKTIYQPMDKHILYTSSDKTLNYSNKLQYSMASMDKETPVEEKGDLYDTLDNLEMQYSCGKCHKGVKKHRPCEAHAKEASVSNSKQLDDMSEFSEPEDLMEGIHVAVDSARYSPPLLPHLTVDNGHVHQEHVRAWDLRGAAGCQVPGGGAFCALCPRDLDAHDPQQLKEEMFQRMLEVDVPSQTGNFTDNIITEEIHEPEPPEPVPEPEPIADELIKTGLEKKTKKFECTKCGKVLRHRNSLMYHMLSHTGKTEMCRECGKEFYTASALKAHKRTHNDDRPYKCEECGRSFRQWGVLKYHTSSLHSKQKLFKCEFCCKEFARKYSLSLHRRIHTGERNYKCDYCNKSFRASSYRLSHMRTHTGDRPYKCNLCEKGFRVTSDLRRHMKIHDKVPPVPKPITKPPKPKEKKKPPKVNAKDEAADEKEKLQNAEYDKTIKKEENSVKIDESKQDKKTQRRKQTIKEDGAPNVTIGHRVENGQYKMKPDYANVEVFDTRQNGNFSKFKEIYSEPMEYNKEELSASYKVKETYNEEVDYKAHLVINEDKDFAILRPMYKSENLESVESDKVYPNRTENTDGKMQVFTQVEKSKEFNGLASRIEKPEVHGENMENSFLERLTALYNIPAI